MAKAITGWELGKTEKQLLVASAVIFAAIFVYRTWINPLPQCN